MAKEKKSGFIIKLSTETVQKLTEEEEAKKTSWGIHMEKYEDSKVTPTDDNTVVPIINKKHSTELDKDCDKVLKSEEKKLENIQPSGSKSDSHDWGEYAPYVSYEGDKAIYTDPTTQQKYTWCSTSTSWKPIEDKGVVPERVYSYENDLHVYTDADGSKYFWDIDKKAWLPKVDDDFLAYYQMSYGFVDNTVKNDEDDKNKSKQPEVQKKSEAVGVKRKAEPQWFDAAETSNTKVYVSNLPLDLTEEEFVDLMQKCGLVMRDPSTQKMKVKLYMDKDQNCFKGDALCTYIKVESVDLALNLLDGSDYKGNKIKVEKAHFQLKGDYNPALKPKKKKKKELEKLKKMQEKLFDWRPEKFIGERSKHERVVIIKNLFTPTDFDNEVQLILDYQQDLREECGKCGEVRKVVIYDRHPEGVAQVTMKEPEFADAVVQLINNRWFGKRQLTAEIWDGRTKYKIAETDSEINKRLDKWGKFLEDGEKVEGSCPEVGAKTDEKKESGEETVVKESKFTSKESAEETVVKESKFTSETVN